MAGGRVSGMKALVTGGAGFIGSNLTVELVDRGHEVVVLDDMYLGTPDNLDAVRDDVEIIEGDVRDRETVREACSDVDVAFHNAARSSSPMHTEDAVEGADVNILGFLNVMEEARDGNLDRVVYASTSTMYGSVDPPHSEDRDTDPVNLYCASKLARETYAQVYANAYGLDVVGLRYFSVYGPRERAKGRFANLVTQFCWTMMDGERPEIWGDGSRTRDFTFVKDIARGNIAAMQADGVAGQVFNLGTGVETRLDDLVAKLNEALGTDIEPAHAEHPKKNKVMRTRADISRTRKYLDWEPQVDIDEGIDRVVDWYA
ncbi:MAG: SDR family NAD(P)-dependent oxidoreductase [Candidatus Nanohaloarchaea archaeon]